MLLAGHCGHYYAEHIAKAAEQNKSNMNKACLCIPKNTSQADVAES